jgi:hypothetical protein
MLGTAFPADRVLLVEQPGPWGRLGLLQSHFDPLMADRLVRSCDAAGVRVLAIRRPGRSGDGAPRRWAWVDAGLGREQMAWGTYDNERELWRQAAVFLRGTLPVARVGADGAAGDRAGVPAYLVCAHGSHDACCAVRGRPVAAALTRLRPDDVWECSHVGGDRFAANILVVPSGVLYGAVRVDELAALVAATDAGEVLGQPLRGKIGLSPEVQAALAGAHAQWGGSLSSYRVLTVGPPADGVVTVRLEQRRDDGVRTADVGIRITRSDVHRLTCHMTRPSRVSNYQSISVTPVGQPES